MNEHARPNDAASILAATRALVPIIVESRAEIERERRLPLRIVDALKQAGAFRMTMPRDWGGAEIDPLSQLQIIEELSVADASVGWCVMIGCDSGYLSGFIDQNVAREMYTDIDMVTACSLIPRGRAVKVPGGYRVSGKWPFSSGCQHSAWIIGGCVVYEGEQAKLNPAGIAETRQCYMPAADVTILDTWYPTGLRGSGSHDFTVTDYFVPDERTYSYQNLTFHRSGSLYRFPLNILYKFASVPVGVARGALESLIADGEKPSRMTTVGRPGAMARTLREEEFVQDAVGRAAAIINAARAYGFATIREVWETLEAKQRLSIPQMANLQFAHAQIFGMCTEAVELLFKARGGTAVYAGNQLDRCLRDMLTMNQHVMNSLRTYGVGGRLLLGLPIEQLLL
ncbi:MAG: acyl-CoA dehydrogenase [Deltaproteobacteria bacterium]|nr:acyl-CoA dehydrogenase [Deltaproteobacteria bacterium]